jgi:hypothetical protein
MQINRVEVVQLGRLEPPTFGATIPSSGCPFKGLPISLDLMTEGVEYKKIIEPQTLKQFVNTISDVRLVVHPTQKAKIGIVPANANFSFENGVSDTGKTDSDQRSTKSQKQANPKFILIQFLQMLSKLDDETLNEVHIPVRVLARIVGDK